MRSGYIRYWPDYKNKNDIVDEMDVLVDNIMIQISSETEQLHDYIGSLEQEDTLVVYDLWTLGDSVNNIIETLSILKEKKINILLLNINLNEEEKCVLFNNELVQSIVYKTLFNILQSIELISQKSIRNRTNKGIDNAKKSQGRPKKYTKDSSDEEDRAIYYLIINMLKQEQSISDISTSLGVSRNTIYRIKEELEDETDLDK